jgi:hypothetical protein
MSTAVQAATEARNTVATDRAVCRKIMAIREKARATLGVPAQSMTCPTCRRAVGAPYRRVEGVLGQGGRIVEGCVDASHAGHLIPGGYNAQWHDREEGRQVRRAELGWLSR